MIPASFNTNPQPELHVNGTPVTQDGTNMAFRANFADGVVSNAVDPNSLRALNEDSPLVLNQANLSKAEVSRKARGPISESSAGNTSAARIARATEEKMKKFRLKLPEKCSSMSMNNVEQEREVQLLYGEVEFTGLGGHRAHYVIAHALQEKPDEILRWMFTSPYGWRLKPPNLILFGYGGRDHYVNWSSSESLKNRRAWGYSPTVPAALDPQHPHQVVPPSNPNARTKNEAQFHKKFKGRMGEIAGGVCQAVLECGGWFDFGHGQRGGMGEILKDGLKVYWSAFGCLAGHKENSVVLAVRELEDTEFADQFMACARNTIPQGTELPPLEERVMYPSVDSVLFPELSDVGGGAEDVDDLDPDDFTSVRRSKNKDGASSVGGSAKLEAEVKHKITYRFLLNSLTHIIFVQNKIIKDKLRLHLKELANRAAMVANGNPLLIQPGVEGKILSEAIAGTPIICLHHTGGAAEVLGNAVNRRRQHVDVDDGDGVYTLPENVPDDHILILNPAKDSVEKVINKLTLVLSTVTDREMMEVGYQKGERSRLRYAWEMFTLFKYNAAIQLRRARLLHYVMVSLAVVVTLVATLNTGATDESLVEDSDIDDNFVESLQKYMDLFGALLLLLPVLNGFFMTISSRFNPIGKWAHLESGAVMLKSEIYQYRCRVAQYMPRKGANLCIEEKVENMCTMPPAAHDIQAQEFARKAVRQRKKDSQKSQIELSRRGAFALEIEAIHSETIGSELRADSLSKPSAKALQTTLAQLYDSKVIKESHDLYHLGLCQKCCSCCQRRIGSIESLLVNRMAEDNKTEWKKVFSDFRANPNVIDDDFLRDDGFSLITAEDYVHFRMMPLIQYYNSMALYLSRRVHTIQFLSFALTGVLTGAAAFGLQAWAPFIVTCMAALNSMDELEHYSSRLRNVNQSLEVLKNLHFWWQSLSMVERRLPANKEILVQGTEGTVDAEVSTWKKALKSAQGVSKASNDGEKDEES